jgi:hypothetical protein
VREDLLLPASVYANENRSRDGHVLNLDPARARQWMDMRSTQDRPMTAGRREPKTGMNAVSVGLEFFN